MKIVSKAYLLIAVLIAVAVFNLFLLYQEDRSLSAQSNPLIRAGEIKVKAEAISSSAISVAAGDVTESNNLENEIDEVNTIMKILSEGGMYNDQPHEGLPPSMNEHYSHVDVAWDNYQLSVGDVVTTSRFNPEAIRTSEYVLEKNQEMILLTNQLVSDLRTLDRDYNAHKKIASDLVECVKVIGEQALLIRTGEEFTTKQTLDEKQLEFEIGVRKLLQIPTDGLNVESVGKTHDMLEPIPRENSEALRQIDPLWESISIRIDTLETSGILSEEYTAARESMNNQKGELNFHLDHLIEFWNEEIASATSEQQIIIQVLLGVDIAVFFIVLFLIRQSLSPLESITKGISRVREGVYGEKIDYKGTDEIGQLVNNFNIMSQTIQEKEEEARKTDVAKDEFLAMITHELKTPLVPIQGYSDILLSEHLGKLTDKQKERINIIKNSSETLLSIISDLLDAQKLELGQLKMKKENANLKDSINKAVISLLPQAEQNGISINYYPVDIIVPHDSERIAQVLTNLIKNSMAAVSSDTGIIGVSVEDLPSEVKVSVKDNGIGIPLDKQKDLFKKFYQVDASLTREAGGSGLGLAISKGIIDNHSGEISVQSIPNQGSTFSFTLPKVAKDVLLKSDSKPQPTPEPETKPQLTPEPEVKPVKAEAKIAELDARLTKLSTKLGTQVEAPKPQKAPKPAKTRKAKEKTPCRYCHKLFVYPDKHEKNCKKRPTKKKTTNK